MAIEFYCNNCYQLISTPDDTGGKKGRCPHCSHIMEIPLQSTGSPPAGGNLAGGAAALGQTAPAAKPQAAGGALSDPHGGSATSSGTWGTATYDTPTNWGSGAYGAPQSPYQSPAGYDAHYSDKSKIAAGLLGIFLGAYGVHRFYLGDVSTGLIQILVTIVTCGIGGIWGFVEGILILTGSINRDADGRLLRD